MTESKVQPGNPKSTVKAAKIKEIVLNLLPAADTVMSDGKKLNAMLSAAVKKASEAKAALLGVQEDFGALVNMLRYWSKGEYRELPIRTAAISVCAIIYFLTPIDLIPDIIPLTGFLDDATVIGFLAASVKKDIDNFRIWEASNKSENADNVNISPDSVK